MKKLYTFLAFLMFACFVTITGSLILNKQLEKMVAQSKTKIDTATKEFNDSLEDGLFYHNLYFTNCFPNVCAKFSYAKFKETIKHVDPVSKTTTEKKETLEVGATEYIIIEYSPIFGKIFVQAKPNNIIVNKNGEKFATFYYSGLNFKSTSNLLSYYNALLSGDGEELLKLFNEHSEINVKRFKASVEDKRLSIDNLKASSNVKTSSAGMVTAKVNVAVDGLVADNDGKFIDLAYDVAFNNIPKELTDAFAQSSNSRLADKIKAATSVKAVEEEIAKEGIKLASVILNSVQNIDKNQTSINVERAYLREYTTTEGKVDEKTRMEGSVNLTLDAQLDPKGFVKLDTKTTDVNLLNLIENVKINDLSAPVEGQEPKTYKLYVKNEDGSYSVNLKAENGEVIINDKDKIVIKGAIKSTVEFAAGIIGMMQMGFVK